MRRYHAMPFGSELRDGVGYFRLWAPAAKEVELTLSHECGRMAATMRTEGDGWFVAAVPDLVPDVSYMFRIDDRINVPDPASRYNPQDVHAASALVDPRSFDWSDAGWRGMPWEQAVVYELHVGTFTSRGTFEATIERLDYLVHLGVTALELMPVADFPGKRNWGYDGVLPFAPDSSYGSPDDLKRLIEAAHNRGLMVLLDVVYNHFGPEGNYLMQYAPQFFDCERQTPWGAAINFDGPGSRTVRDFFIHNALYWLEEFHIDGLRLDAVHAIADRSDPDIICELAAAVHDGPGRDRHVHIVLENDLNDARYLKRDPDGKPLCADAQWDDDVHHALHVLVTQESEGYYQDYADRPLWWLGRALAQGFGYQGEASPHRRGEKRGVASADLPPSAFVTFMQTHDQIGNRAFGDRISAIAPPQKLRLAVTCILLAPHVPMLFMGEEFAASSPFLFFCDFGPDLANAVRDGRRAEFAAFESFSNTAARHLIPDPGAESTFTASKLAWTEAVADGHSEWHSLYRELLECRREQIVPHLKGKHYGAHHVADKEGRLAVDWTLPDATRLHLRANFSDVAWTPPPACGTVIYTSSGAASKQSVPHWGALWTLETTP